jgi:hypothetical protein
LSPSQCTSIEIRKEDARSRYETILTDVVEGKVKTDKHSSGTHVPWSFLLDQPLLIPSIDKHIAISKAITMSFNFWAAGCIFGATSVVAGAFGAHGLKSRGFTDAKVATWNTAAHYQVLGI